MLPSTPGHLSTSFSAFSLREVEYIAEEQLIEIIPAFTQERTIELGDGGTYGPFYSGIPCTIPLHVAFTLKKTKQCQIVQPDWFTVDSLHSQCQQEQQEPEHLAEVHRSYLEVGQLQLNFAKDNLDQPDTLREKMNSLELQRQTKLFNKLKQIDADSVVLKLDNATPMEIQWVRDTLYVSLKGFDNIRNVNKPM